MLSLCENNKQAKEICFYILDDHISQENKEKLRATADDYHREVQFIDVTELVEHLKEMDVQPWRGGYTAYLKIIAGSYLPDTVDRAICIDADTIVDGSLELLDVLDLQGCPCAMAYENVTATYRDYIGLRGEKYYNSGVIVFDYPNWRSQNVEERFFFHLKNINNRYYHPEQDPISIVLKGSVYTLSPKYNFLAQHYFFHTSFYLRLLHFSSKSVPYYSPLELQEAAKDVRIYHMIDTLTLRPWQKGNSHPFNDLFDHYLGMSRWDDFEKPVVVTGLYGKIKYGLRKYLWRPISNCYFCVCNNLFYAKVAKKFYPNWKAQYNLEK